MRVEVSEYLHAALPPLAAEIFSPLSDWPWSLARIGSFTRTPTRIKIIVSWKLENVKFGRHFLTLSLEFHPNICCDDPALTIKPQRWATNLWG